MRQYKLSGLELAAIAASIFLLASCAANTGTQNGTATGSSSSSLGASVGIPPTTSTATTSTSNASSSLSSSTSTTATASPLSYAINGMGNTAAYICVPAQKTLILRVMPHANTAPLFPANSSIINSKTGLPLYDGSPAAYTQLIVNVSIPGTAASWQYQASNENWSSTGDYSNYLTPVTPSTIAPTSALPTPEYPNSEIIYGSNPNDGMCTFWESQLHGCTLSSSLQTAQAAGCPSGQQKLLITNIISDYPCMNDTVNWCQGGSVQVVPDYQQWSATIEVQTENTAAL